MAAAVFVAPGFYGAFMSTSPSSRSTHGVQLRLNSLRPMRDPTVSRGHTESVESGSAISLFSGAGGLDLGVEEAGFRTTVAVEWDADAADTMEKNAGTYFPGLQEVLRADLYSLASGSSGGVTTEEILRAGGLAPDERPDLLVGGPPCVAFSKSGFWLDWKRDGVDPAASLLQAFTTVLAEAQPRFFIRIALAFADYRVEEVTRGRETAPPSA